MASNNKTLWIVLGVGAGVLLLGCCACGGVGYFVYWGANKGIQAAGEIITRTNDLQQVGFALHNYYDANRRMPANAEELIPLIEDAKVKDRLRSKDIEVVWNAVGLNKDERGASNVIIAWDSKPLIGGQRLVLFMDNSTRTISEAEFQNVPKVKTLNKKDQGATKK